MIVCRCEEVTYGELVETAKKYACSSRELKLRTRAGMGYCGGRTCRGMIEYVVQEENENKNESVPLKYQAPIRPISFGQFGGIVDDESNC